MEVKTFRRLLDRAIKALSRDRFKVALLAQVACLRIEHPELTCSGRGLWTMEAIVYLPEQATCVDKAFSCTALPQ